MADQRTTVLLSGVGRDDRILEIGAGHAPIAPRSAGWNVTVVDHATQEELREKYRNDPSTNIDTIEKVDIVWRGGPLHEAIPNQLLGTYDALIASHVIEHIPDPIGFLQSAAKILHPIRGKLILAVPDKRWCFDCLKQVSSTGQFLAAHRAGAQRHSMVPHFENAAYIAFDHGRASWARETLTDLKLVDTLDTAYRDFQSWSPDPNAPYFDTHGWIFTPASFELLILESNALGLIDWRVGWLQPQGGLEFLTHLVRGREVFASTADREARRLQLLKRILLDIREQTDFLPEIGPMPPSQPDFHEQQLALLREFSGNMQTMRDQNDTTQAASRASNEETLALLQEIAGNLRTLREQNDVTQAERRASNEETLALLHEIGGNLRTLREQNDVTQAESRASNEEILILLHEIAETSSMTRATLRPAQAVWHRLLPIRRQIARLRGRV